MQVAIFKNKDNTFSILVPTQEVLQIATIQQIAEKDVPEGLPYWIVNTSDLPQGIPIEAIEIDETQYPPQGYGGKSNEFPPEVLSKLGGMK